MCLSTMEGMLSLGCLHHDQWLYLQHQQLLAVHLVVPVGGEAIVTVT